MAPVLRIGIVGCGEVAQVRPSSFSLDPTECRLLTGARVTREGR